MKDKKFAKRKEREKRVKDKIMARRSKSRAEAKAERVATKLEYKLRPREEPIIRDDKQREVNEILKKKDVARTEKTINGDIKQAKMQIIKAKNKGMPDKVINRLEDNYQILLALRDEFLEEQETRNAVNEELEEKGIKTLKEKMSYLGEEAINAQKETAIVEVVKAED